MVKKRKINKAKRGGAPVPIEIRREKIMALLKREPTLNHSFRDLCNAGGGIDNGGKEDTWFIIEQLLEEGFAEMGRRNRFRLNKDSLATMVGRVTMQPTGNMYVSVEGVEEDIFVACSMRACVTLRDVPGGPAPNRVREQIEYGSAWLENFCV